MTSTIAAGTVPRGRSQSAGSVRLSSTKELVASMKGAVHISLGAYVMDPGSDLVNALASAASNGSDVRVRLGQAYVDERGEIRDSNAATAERLRAAGAHVVQTRDVEHLKAAVVDGRAFVDDRNWSGGTETVFSDDRPSDVRALRTALDSGVAVPGSEGFAVGKTDALQMEHDVIVSSRHKTLAVASETLTMKSHVFIDLVAAAQREPVHLLVSRRCVRDPQGRVALKQLVHGGVEVRIAAGDEGDEKYCLAGNRAWFGSANMTGTPKVQPLDWGLRTRSHLIVNAVHHRFEAEWKDAAIYRPPDAETPARLTGLTGSGVVG